MSQTMQLARARFASLAADAKATYARYGRFAPVTSFVLGIGFDVLTLGRADQWSNIIQLGVYLAAVEILLLIEAAEPKPRDTTTTLVGRLWKHRDEATHFLLGSLLSAFTLFFVKSASLVGSAVFLAVVALALVANELSAMRRFGTEMRAGLFALCLASYACCLAPVWWGSVGEAPFALGMGAAASWLGATIGLMLVVAKRPLRIPRRFVLPFAAVIASFVAAYTLHLIPPVPVALTHIGIYHDVERIDGGYRLGTLKPSWRFWEQGDQRFAYRSGDRVYCFFSVFSPGGFKDQLRIRWLYDDPKRGWQSADAVPVSVAGGREQGFRAFAFKQNVAPGDWQVRIETSDAREVGRVSMTIELDASAGERRMHYEML
jgi:hypothetical protein